MVGVDIIKDYDCVRKNRKAIELCRSLGTVRSVCQIPDSELLFYPCLLF